MNLQSKLITPSIAKEILESNIQNRKPKIPVVLRYANDMANGKWKEDTGEFIKISKSNILLDGQHRLLALIKANTSIKMGIVTDIEDSVFDVLDTGTNRNGCDVFTISKISYATILPSSIQLYELLKSQKKQNSQISTKKTNAELLELYYEKPLFWDSVAKQGKIWYNDFVKILAPQTICAFYAHFHDISPLQSELFMNQLCSGKEITNNVIILLRNKLINDKTSQKSFKSDDKNAFIIKAWNVFRTNKNIAVLKYNPNVEPFPIAK